MKDVSRFLLDKFLFALCLAFGVAIPICGQTSAGLSAKYLLINAYEVRPGILMTPKFAADGQVCEMELETRHASEKRITFGVFLSEGLLKELVDELAPESQRGKDLKGWFDDTVAGSVTTTKHPYENITVEVYGTTHPKPGGNMVAIIKWRKRVCRVDQSAGTNRGSLN